MNVRSILNLGLTASAALALVTLSFGGGSLAAVRYALPQPAAPSQAPQRLVLAPETLSAKAAVLIDLESGEVLYQKNAYEPLPLASLTKLMASEVVLSKADPTTLVEITREDLLPEGDSGLRVGQALTLDSLLRLSLIASSNDAMQAAVSTLGDDPVAAMNQAARELGLHQTHFYNPTGLDTSLRDPGAVGSAYDVARLAAIFFKHHPTYFELTTRPGVVVDQGGKELKADATSLPLQQIPGFVAAKTGYTDLAGGNLVAIFDLQPGTTAIAAVLGSTRNGRFVDVETLISAARESLRPLTP